MDDTQAHKETLQAKMYELDSNMSIFLPRHAKVSLYKYQARFYRPVLTHTTQGQSSSFSIKENQTISNSKHFSYMT